MDPDSAMINEGEAVNVSTTIRTYRGLDPVKIQDITCACKNTNDTITYTPVKNNDDSWTVNFTGVNSESSTVYVDIFIKISDTITRTKTFSIYQTKYDADTISVDFGDDHLLIPCSDGITPDSGIFPMEIPVSMRVGGYPVDITGITSVDSNFDNFSFENGIFKITGVPADKSGSIGFIVTDGTNSITEYINYTKFNTVGGTISMYRLNVNANDIVCDTRSGENIYTVYNGKLGSSNNIITATVFKYSSEG